MKKETTSNPLKTFNDNNAKTKMKAGGVMKAFKKSLPKAQLGLGLILKATEKEEKKPSKPSKAVVAFRMADLVLRRAINKAKTQPSKKK